jgi:anhydro-N-acetylmuramic acid kinase
VGASFHPWGVSAAAFAHWPLRESIMTNVLRPDAPQQGDSRRLAVGVLVSSDCTRLFAVLIAGVGRGMPLVPQVVDGMIAQIPDEIAAMYRQLVESTESVPPADALAVFCRLQSGLSELEGSLVNALLEQAGVVPSRVLVVGIYDPGIWHFGKGTHPSYTAISDPARVAELTSLNVVDAFPARDVACGGQGGPIFAQAEWVVLGDPDRSRVVVDLGKTTRLTYLPSRSSAQIGSRVLSFEVGPGMRLVDLLAERFSGGENSFDPGGRFAVQGCCIDELLAHWMSDPYFRRPLPRWQPRGVRPERYLLEAMQMAVERGWSIRDVLCTSTHLIAAMVGHAAKKVLLPSLSIDEVLVTGGGQQNGLLLRELGSQFPGVPMLRASDVGVESEAYAPMCVAVLALLHVDQVPGNSAEVTGAEVARVLGRLTPGSPQSWQRLTAEFGVSVPAVRSLRSAL